MANLDWIRRTVNTEGCRCPYADRACPGTRKGRAGCALWITEEIAEGQERAIVEGCLVAFTYAQGYEIVQESVRSQAAMHQGTAAAAAVLRLATTRGGAHGPALHAGG